MRAALVYDRVNRWGGAERVLLALHQIFPQAPLYTAVYNPKTAPWAKNFQVIPSFLQKFPFAKNHHEIYPWLTSLAFESFNFDFFDIVISVTSAEAKGIITKPSTLHICYCLTPTRYLWSGYQDYFRQPIFKFLSQPVVSYLRSWDQVTAQRVDQYLAISENVRRRIKKYYNRQSTVIYPPVDTKKLKAQNSKRKTQKDSFFLIVSRLVPYKRVDTAVKAFNKLKLPLIIVGDGVERKCLERLANKNIKFLGQNLTEAQLLGYYQNCRALILPGEEDLGLAVLEAQACGRPVIAFKRGGARETVVEGKTGEFFYPQKWEILAKTVSQFDEKRYNLEDCRKNALKFDQEIFKKKFRRLIEKIWQKHR